MEKVVKQVIPENLIDNNTVYHLQPSGVFIIGGPMVSLTIHPPLVTLHNPCYPPLVTLYNPCYPPLVSLYNPCYPPLVTL